MSRWFHMMACRAPQCLLFTLWLMVSAIASADAPERGMAVLRAALHEAMTELPPGARVAATLQRANGDRLLTHDADQMLTPASTMKLLTAVSAWHALGPEFRLKTRLVAAADNNVALVFSGDPLFDRVHLKAMLAQAAAAGLKSIEGDFLLDGTVFAGHDVSGAQSWNDLSICFAAPASAISLNHNCVQGNLSGDQPGTRMRIFIGADEPLRFINRTRVLPRDQAEARLCEVELSHIAANRYLLSGCSSPRRRALPLSIAVNDPVQYVRQILLQELKRAGIKLRGGVHLAKRSVKGRLLVGHQSVALPELIEHMLLKSDNQIADVLFRTMGARYLNAGTAGTNYPGTYRAGAEAVRAQLKALQIDPGNARLADGSGLSRHNLLSAELLAALLAHMQALPRDVLTAALPVSGESGSLKYRRGLLNPPLRGKVAAKTGTLTGVYNLAGFVEHRSGEQLQFVLLIDGFSLAPEQAKRVARRPSLHPLKRFYERFLGEIHALKLPDKK